MARLIQLKSHRDERGLLTVLQDEVPFDIRRIYYIQQVPSEEVVRGMHRHKTSRQALICVSGECEIFNNDGKKEETFLLDSPSKCLIIEPSDWHLMRNFSGDAVLLVLASTKYDITDYIDEPYS